MPSDVIESVGARALFDALPRALIVLDTTGVILLWNLEAERVYGWSEAEVLGRAVADVLPLAEDGLADRLARVAGGERTEGDRTVTRRDGTLVRVLSSASPVRAGDDEVVAVVSLSGDVTSLRVAEQEVRDLNETLRLALEAGQLGTWRWDMATGGVTWDTTLESIYGFEPGSFDGTFEAYVAALHPDDRDHVLATVREAVANGDRYRLEHRIVRRDGEVRWVAAAGEVVVDADGAPTGTLGCVGDVTERVEQHQRLERAVAEHESGLDRERILRERFEFLSTINEALNEAQSVAEIMVNVARVSVPRLGDWCSVHVLPFTGGPPEVEIAHVDPEMVAYARALQERFPYDPRSNKGVASVIRTGQSMFFPEISPEVLDQLDVDDEERRVLDELALRSAIAVPIVKRGRVLGAMQFVMSSSGRRYTEDDLSLAELVGARLAASVENRRLSELHRETAQALQQALLPGSLPEIDGVELAVGYWPAGEGAQVGGDFYDVFHIAEDRWALVVGDVCGTGPFAASVTGLARHSLRDAVWHGDPPGEVLRSLNRSILRSGFQTFCTAVFATLERRDHGVELTVTSGGHPLPIHIGSTTRVVGREGALLGVLETTWSTTVTTALASGDFLVFYTDGATDLPPPHGLTPEEFLELVQLAASRSETAAQLAAAIHALLDERRSFHLRDDDLALLVLRVR